jgi:hypothetical protein
MCHHIRLGLKYIKTICIKGIEYINDDYEGVKLIKLGVPYIKSLKYDGVEYFNIDYKEPDKQIKNIGEISLCNKS